MCNQTDSEEGCLSSEEFDFLLASVKVFAFIIVFALLQTCIYNVFCIWIDSNLSNMIIADNRGGNDQDFGYCQSPPNLVENS